jgi:hypothetical protein
MEPAFILKGRESGGRAYPGVKAFLPGGNFPYSDKQPLDRAVEWTNIANDESGNPCLKCGACVRSSGPFYWGETDLAPGGSVPQEFTEPLSDFWFA